MGRTITRTIYHNRPDWSHIFTAEECATITENGWVVANAPRPLKGAVDVLDDAGRLVDITVLPAMQGYPQTATSAAHGIFWVAGPREQCEDSWARDDATLVELVDDARVEQLVDAALAADEYSIDDYTDHGLGYPEAAAAYRLPYGIDK